METYKETVLRYRVLKRTNFDPNTPEGRAIRAEYALNGIDPDDSWSLTWSFDTLEEAEAQAAEEREFWKEPRYTIKVADAGEATVIERSIW